MSKGIVDFFKSVEVHKEQGAGHRIFRVPHHCLVQPIAQKRSIWKAGQGIMASLMRECLLGLLAFGDIAHGRHVSVRLAVFVDNARRAHLGRKKCTIPPASRVFDTPQDLSLDDKLIVKLRLLVVRGGHQVIRVHAHQFGRLRIPMQLCGVSVCHDNLAG